MSIDLTIPSLVITAPNGVDGYGEVATLNDRSAGTFVGYLWDMSFGRLIRESADDKADRSGGIHGPFRSGRLPFTLEIMMAPDSTVALSNARADKLTAACDAAEADGSIVWTEAGRVATRLLFRQQQSLRGPGKDRMVTFAGISADPLILANAASGPTAPTSGLTNAGKAATFPSFSFTSGASGTVVISRTSPGPTETLTLTIGGTSGLAASTATTIDFATGAVLQGSTDKRGAVQFPASVWWAMAPGANTISVTGASSALVSWRSAWRP